MAGEIEPTRPGVQDPWVLLRENVAFSRIRYSDPMGWEDKGDVELSGEGFTVHVVYDSRRKGDQLATMLETLRPDGKQLVLSISEAPETPDARKK